MLNCSSLPPIAILGAGAWGTALAIHLARQGQAVRLWSYDPQQVAAINQTHHNTRYFPEYRLSETIVALKTIAETITPVEDILIAVPSLAFRDTLHHLAADLKPHHRLVWATKGLDATTHQPLHEIAQAILGSIDKAILSGPSFAREVAVGLPTAVTLASQQPPFLEALAKRFRSPQFRVDCTQDVLGVELGGAVKNTIAIAMGIVDGLEFGANTKAALMTQALTEMIALGRALGAQQETFLGLSGLGDLILTCTDNQSRNRRLGLALGQGQTLEKASASIGTTEGLVAARHVFYLLQQHPHVEAPLCTAVYRILYKHAPMTILLDFFNQTTAS